METKEKRLRRAVRIKEELERSRDQREKQKNGGRVKRNKEISENKRGNRQSERVA